jgi:hypothetical protein
VTEGPDSDPPPSQADDERPAKGVDRKLVAALSLSFVVVCTVIAITGYRSCRDECSDWDDQIRLLDTYLSAYVRTKGPSRLEALASIQRLDLPCDKVAQARNLCLRAYRNLERAEAEHDRAKSFLDRIEKAIKTLGPSERDIAGRKLLDGEDLETIALKTNLPVGEVSRRLEAAEKKLQSYDLPRLHREFEEAVERSDDLLRAAQQTNEDCDGTFKRLLRESQR